MKSRIIFIFFLIVAQSSFGQSDKYNTVSDVLYVVEQDVVGDPYIQERCVLDIYYPENKKQAVPVVIWFHGGGLSGGDKYIPENLKQKGVCIVAVNYRLYPSVTPDKCIEDAASAITWVYNNISNYGGDPSLIFVSGHSAGGYLAALVGLDKKWLKKHGIDANSLAGIIPISGHTITHSVIRKQEGIPDYQPLIDEYAPLYYVRNDSPPMLLITGDRELEMLGRYEENAYLFRMMKVAGHTETKIYELDGFGHGNMVVPACQLLLNEITRIVQKRGRIRDEQSQH
jgi:acetyl esterase/lipase